MLTTVTTKWKLWLNQEQKIAVDWGRVAFSRTRLKHRQTDEIAQELRYDVLDLGLTSLLITIKWKKINMMNTITVLLYTATIKRLRAVIYNSFNSFKLKKKLYYNGECYLF